MANDAPGSAPQTEAHPPPTDESARTPLAWQPLTPRGIAAFSGATFGRVFLVQVVVAVLAASTVLWFLHHAWFPVVGDAIRHLPPTGAIRGRELSSPEVSVEPLAETRLLAFSLNVGHEAHTSSAADLRVEFHQKNIQLCSFFGCLPLSYWKDHEFNRPELEPLWGAWEPILLGMAWLGTAVFLLLCWSVLATFYFLFVRLLAWRKERRITLAGSWRLAAAALMPGALLFTVGILLYGLGWLNLIGLLLTAALHLAAGWILSVMGTLALSPASKPPAHVASANPFAAPPPPAPPGPG